MAHSIAGGFPIHPAGFGPVDTSDLLNLPTVLCVLVIIKASYGRLRGGKYYALIEPVFVSLYTVYVHYE